MLGELVISVIQTKRNMKFHGTEVDFEECDGEFVASAFFLSSRSNEHHYLALSRNLSPAESGDVFIEIDDQVHSARGGVLRCELHADCLRLKINETTAKELRLADTSEIIVSFSLEYPALVGLRKALLAIFGGTLVMVEDN
jgi:hypothetical protein